MTSLAETKKAMGNALKTHLGKLALPGEQSKKVNTKMQLVAQLDSGCEATLACAEVSGGRPAGHYGLYWTVSLREGPIWKVMVDTGLDKAKNVFSDVLFRTTSHNVSKISHFEVGPQSDFDAVAAAIDEALKKEAFPLVKAFNSDFNDAVEYLAANRPVEARNPFTTCVILLHLAQRTDRLAELKKTAASKPGFYDFVDNPDPQKNIVEPIERWFKANRK